MSDTKVITNKKVRLVFRNWDDMCSDSIGEHGGFRITEKGRSDLDEEPGMYSIHSPMYGTTYLDEHAYEDQWSCECGELTGHNYKGKICPKCKKVVQYVDVNMETTGWIILDNHVVINPIFYKKLQYFIRANELDSILNYKDVKEREQWREQHPEVGPYYGIGISEFAERFDEIMNYYYGIEVKKTSKKKDIFFEIMIQKSAVFAHSIPVYSTHLRPFVVKNEEINYSDDDKLYKRIYTNHTLLNDRYELDVKNKVREKTYERTHKGQAHLRAEGILYAIQKDIDALWNFNFNAINKKEGWIVEKVIAGRLDFTARNVIVSDKDLMPDEISLGYMTFLELYKMEITSILTHMYGISYPVARKRVKQASIEYDDQIYKIMMYMVEKRGCYCLINRNPTINYGSQMAMRIAYVNPSMTDFCMALPELVLQAFNADFDGDVMNIMSLKPEDIKSEYYEQLNPLNILFISKNDGKYNMEASLFKEESIGLYCFVNI